MTETKTEPSTYASPWGSGWLIVRAGWPLIGASVAVASVGLAVGLWWLVALSSVAVVFLLWFFRNPRREPPAGESVIVSPADGKVIEIESCREERFLQRDMVRLGIFMSPLDVHVNRMPCAGKVVAVHYFPGRYLMAFHPKASLENEHQAMIVETDQGMKLVVVQVAGFLARRIETWVRVGDHLGCGERFGMIRLGSKVDLYVPTSVAVNVRIGDRLKAGRSVVGVMA